MRYQLAQMNIAKFKLPKENPANDDFVNNIDFVNTEAEKHPGFVWRLKDEDTSPIDLQIYEDPSIIVNMSVWDDLQSLAKFVYQNDDHKHFMRRRKEWFDKLEFHMVLWWLEPERLPTIEEGKLRLELLKQIGPSPSAFNFKSAFAPPQSEPINAFEGLIP